jgi:G:T-mismatch repair DNA endonuclease (very short patch repair protein)
LVRGCSVENCPNRHIGKGYCGKHYQKFRRYGNPLYVPDAKEISKKLSRSLKGKKRSDAIRKKMSESSKRENLSDATLKRMSESHIGKTPWNKGKMDVYSDATLKRMSESSKRENLSDATLKRMSESAKKKPSVRDSTRMKMSEASKQIWTDKNYQEKMSESSKRENLSDATLKRMSESSKRENLSDATLKRMSESQSTPERKAQQRETLRKIRHNQTSPTNPELTIMKILTDNGIKYKFNPNVEYLTLENEHRKKEIDFLIKPKKIIEFNGYRHYDNRDFKPDDVVTHHNKPTKCQDIWDEEDTVLNQIKKEGYKILIVWDWDLKKNLDKTTKKILKFAKS